MGSVVDKCASLGDETLGLLRFLLEQGAEVDRIGGPQVFELAIVAGLSVEMRELLVEYGARTVFEEDEEVSLEEMGYR